MLQQRRRNKQKILGSDQEEGEKQRDGSILEAKGKKLKKEGVKICAKAARSNAKRLRTSH